MRVSCLFLGLFCQVAKGYILSPPTSTSIYGGFQKHRFSTIHLFGTLTESGDSHEHSPLDIDSLVDQASSTTSTTNSLLDDDVNGVDNEQIIEEEEELDEQSLMDIDMMKHAIQMAQSR